MQPHALYFKTLCKTNLIEFFPPALSISIMVEIIYLFIHMFILIYYLQSYTFFTFASFFCSVIFKKSGIRIVKAQKNMHHDVS